MLPTTIAVPSCRRARCEVGGGAGRERSVDEVVPVALGDERHEQLSRVAVERESNDAPSTSTSGPARVPPTAAATSMPATSRPRNGTVRASERRSDPPRGAVRRAVGGARCQLHDRGARARPPSTEPLPRHARRHLDRRRVVAGDGCDRGADPRAAGACRRGSIRTALGWRRRRCSPTRLDGPRAHGRAAVAARPDGRGRHGARACSSSPTSPYVGAGVLGSALAMDKAMAKQVLAAAGIPQARYRAFPEHELDARPSGRARRAARTAVLRQARQHGIVRRRHQGPRPSRICATRSTTRSPTTNGSSSRKRSSGARSRWP